MSGPPPGDPASPASARHGVARNALHLVMGQVATTTLAVLLSAALGRSLGAAEFGLYFLFTSMAAFALVVVEWGQGQLVIREVARQPERADVLLGSGVALRAGGTLAAAVVTAAVTALLGHDRRGVLLATLMLLAQLPFFVAQAYGSAFRGRERMEYDAAVSVLNKALTLALAVLALLAGTGLPGVVAAQGAAGLGAVLLAARLGGRLGIRARGFSAPVARELLVGGTPIVAMSLAISAQAYLDAVVLSKLAPEQVVGWFGAARNVLGTLVAPATILASAAFPRFSRAAGDAAALRVETQAALRPVILLAGYACAGTWLFAELAVSLIYGAEGFGPAALLLKVSAPGFFLLFVDVLLGSVCVAAGRAARLAGVKAANVAVTTGLQLVLIPHFQARYGNGGLGGVVAFVGSELMMFAGAAAILPRGVLGASVLVDLVRAAAVTAGTLLLLGALPALPPPVTLLASALAYALLAVATGLLRRGDVEVLAALLRSKAAARARR